MPAGSRSVLRNDFSRVFLLEGGSGPNVAPVYEGFWAGKGVKWSLGDITLTRQPSSTVRGLFDTIGDIPAALGIPELTITSYFGLDLDDVLRIGRKECRCDVQMHFGLCGAPQDYDGGWEKIGLLVNGRITDYAVNNIGALNPGERANIMEDVPFHGWDYYEIKRLIYGEAGDTQLTREATDITVCGTASCGACGLPSDGCQIVFACMKSSGAGSPGILGEVIASQDGGATWIARTITGIGANNNPSAIACVSSNLIVVSQDAAGVFYAPINNVLTSSETWAKVTSGIVGGGEPAHIFSPAPSKSWLVGAGGYIYVTSDPTSGLTVQSAGSATTQTLNAVHGSDLLHVMAVGNSNAVVYTENGGTIWSSVTGPNPGIALNCCFQISDLVWWVGDAAGKLWYTLNKGQSWTERTFPGSGTGNVAAIKFVGNSVGYMTHATAANVGRVLRTISGGHSWYVGAESLAPVPTNARFNAIGTCTDVNQVFLAGLKSTSGLTDGIIVKGA